MRGASAPHDTRGVLDNARMLDLAALIARIVPVDTGAAAATQRLLDAKTKPLRSLGRLEDLACQVAAIRGRTERRPDACARRSS